MRDNNKVGMQSAAPRVINDKLTYELLFHRYSGDKIADKLWMVSSRFAFISIAQKKPPNEVWIPKKANWGLALSENFTAISEFMGKWISLRC